ncbi:MAG: imidazolonepropionase [Clostridiales bacterium]|nr:imidazolonepropionase [Clostridiales bacterium]
MRGCLLVKNIGTLQTATGNSVRCGSAQGENTKLENAAILIKDGMIEEITCDGELPKSAGAAGLVLDAEGNLVTPGLVDAHTHLVFGGYRQNEIPLKLKGASYVDILKAGGGILDTVKKTRRASFEELYEKSTGFLDEMLALGVTACEAKSGYGLDFENEIKQLEVLKKIAEEHPIDIVATYMGAHAVPEEYKGKPDEYISMVCGTVMPYVAENGLAEYCDVFCEDSAFNVGQSREYLLCAKACGFGLKIHADEIEAIGGSKLAGELRAASAEHLIATDEEGIEALSKSGTVAVLLPGTSFYLGKQYAPARRMIELGVPVALATDFNPGSCPSLNLQLIINMACLKYKMTPEEILTAVTINAACAVGRGGAIGTLEKGKQGDLVVWDAKDMETLCYRFGSNLALQVIKKGELV